MSPELYVSKLMARRYVGLAAALLLSAGGLAAQDTASTEAAAFLARRRELVERFIAGRGIRDSATLRAMRIVPRHEFVRPEDRDQAYGDYPLPIGYGQTISQPYIVAYMTELIGPRPGLKVLEVGTGSGYQAAILAATGCAVYTMEIFRALAESARERLARLGYGRVEVRHGDGHFGWPEAAPFDAILVTAAGTFVPPALTDQLKPGGRLVIPIGTVSGVQNLILVTKDSSGALRTRTMLPVRFVPLLRELR